MHKITTSEQLQNFCDAVLKSKETFITVDTEFVREKTYWPEPCLIQIATSTEVVLIDPLAKGLDINLLKPLFFEDKITKVFHAARQDLEIFFNLWGALPAPLFDTQIAAMVLGFGESVGYATLVENICKQQLDKTFRFTDWKKRPLNASQEKYASEDVTYLRDVYLHLFKLLQSKNRIHWIEEEMKILTSPQTYQTDPDTLWLKLKPRSKNPRFLARLKALSTIRDQWAQKHNLARHIVMGDSALLAIASDPPKSLKHLQGNPKLKNTPKNFLEKILQVLEEAEKLSIADCPRMPEKPKTFTDSSVFDLLRVFLKNICETEQVAAKIVATQDDLNALIRGKQTRCLEGWRYEVFGQQAQLLLKGELALTLENQKLQVLKK